jgi:hypothetical protein
MPFIAPQPGVFFGGPKNWRELSNSLCIWALCERATCRKARVCRGDSRACAADGISLLSQDALSCAMHLAISLKGGLSLDEARAALRPDHRKGWRDWRAAVRRARRSAKRQRKGAERAAHGQ